jgi:CheY-like chemotaxis protein
MTQCETVAIVDDDSAVCWAVSRLLEVHGYVTEQYSSGEEFLCAVTRTAASCLVIDIHLGDITGVELGRQLLAMDIKLPIIFVTGSRDDSIRAQAFDLGCAGFFQKPFRADELISAIEKAAGPPPTSTANDPLLRLLQRYEAELAAFDGAPGAAGRDWDKIAETTWSRTQDEIIERKLKATSAAGARLALDHVLKSELFTDRRESADQQMLWLLIKAARDYIDDLETGEQTTSTRSATASR